MTELIKIGLSGGLVVGITTFLLNLTKDYFAGRAKKADEASFDALFIIARLDALVVECANSIWDYNNQVAQLMGTEHEDKIGSCSRPDTPLEDLKLDKVDRALAARLIWLENEIIRGGRVILARWELYLDSDEANEQNTSLVGYYGWEAWLISEALRDKYSLRYTGPGWGMKAVKDTLAEEHTKAKKYLNRND
ncbi:hypothetical protein [Pseudomonas sp. OHS18]|uniref:hypothetical protein n=1 Tax=Pseudomonas sp. OHS18 TaxID=3399679 RepID=UPI003A860CC5